MLKLPTVDQELLEDEPEQPEVATEPAAGSTLREMAEMVVFIVLIFFIQRGLVQNFRIEGPSMLPNLHQFQYIFVNKVVYFHYDTNAPLRLLPGSKGLPVSMVYPFRTPERGEIVVLEAPTANGEVQTDYIKRVIGLPGETIQIKDGKVLINGQVLDEPYLNQSTECGGNTALNNGLCEPYVVPADAVVVLGDNRGVSQNSRRWDAAPGLPMERIVGKAWFCYWPKIDWGVIPTPSYPSLPASSAVP